ncbi:MAG: hypothetical protein JWL64_867 [Frankiales bacterium]|nr:hypothetical protein [Frankiales bacterium]
MTTSTPRLTFLVFDSDNHFYEPREALTAARRCAR